MITPDRVDGYLQLTRRAYTPSPELRERVQMRLQAGALPLAVPAPFVGASPAGSQTLRRRVANLALSGAALALGLAGGYTLRPAVGDPPPLPQPRFSQQLLAPEVEAPRDTPATPGWAPSAARLHEPAVSEPAPARSRRPVRAAVPHRLQPQPDDVPVSARGPNEELALLARAERAVRAGNSALALVLIAELEARFPRSGFLEERRAIELVAHCSARAGDARSRAERFLREHPRSVYAERVAELCPLEPAAGPP